MGVAEGIEVRVEEMFIEIEPALGDADKDGDGSLQVYASYSRKELLETIGDFSA